MAKNRNVWRCREKNCTSTIFVVFHWEFILKSRLMFSTFLSWRKPATYRSWTTLKLQLLPAWRPKTFVFIVNESQITKKRDFLAFLNRGMYEIWNRFLVLKYWRYHENLLNMIIIEWFQNKPNRQQILWTIKPESCGQFG